MKLNIEQEQHNFIKAIRSRQLSPSTQDYYKSVLSKFLQWLKGEKLKLHQVSYNTTLEYVAYCKKYFKPVTINKCLGILQQYFAVKVKEGLMKKNPVLGIKLRGIVRHLPKSLLDSAALEKLYKNYPNHSLIDKRNRVMLGLLVFQGLSSADLKLLRVSHVKVQEGKLYVPGSPVRAHRGGLNSRVLELKANQLLELHHYIIEVRPEMTRKSTDRLFVGDLESILKWLSIRLRRQNKDYINVVQLRASVITKWLKEKDVRIVQYMAGHKSVGSTEQFKTVRLENLQQALDQYHPLG
jgi:integrase/recombinase XerD